ncbi:nuclear transport factor 2 family protein [Sphingomonas sp. URHD0057]|uniref:nuclear transport factor 2 family protein n=1 Tax=Sphingomonas sp. URHD0057 TaxID=1380389 RepID=UPI0018CC3A7A|nr:nuclear transport factor 2 family protein [Sphingomonas sp. URHD0057]
MAENNRELIEALENEWRDALCSQDMDRLRSLVHPDFVLIGSRSTGAFMMGRDDWLEAIQRRDVDAIEIEIRDATALERVMVGTVLAKWRVKYLGRIIEDCVLLTDVWVFDGGRWQVVRRHSTPAPAGECAKGS